MAAYFYTVVVTSRNQITEVSGVIDESDVEAARAQLIRNGYLIRELRPARQEELQLDKYRKLKNRLRNIKNPKEIIKQESMQRRILKPIRRLNWPWILFLLFISILIILCVYMERH